MNVDVYRTSDRGLAAYFLLKGFNFLGCIPSNHADPRRMDFVFIGVTTPRDTERPWYAKNKELMSAAGYFECLTTITRATKEPITHEEVEALRRQRYSDRSYRGLVLRS